MQHVRELRQPQSLSAPARPDLVYQWESFATALREYAALFVLMHREVGHHRNESPADPDYQQYLNLELGGVLRFLAVRHDGCLVGFLMCMIGPPIDFNSTRWGSIVKIYLRPEFRAGARGMKLLRLAHERMRGENVKLVTAAAPVGYTTKRKRGTASLLDFAGYEPIETVYAKVLE